MPKHALITGATSGIGYELTRLFAHDGHNVVLVARSANDLDRVAGECRGLGVAAHTIAKDLTKPGAPDEIFAEVKSLNIPINFLVNNPVMLSTVLSQRAVWPMTSLICSSTW